MAKESLKENIRMDTPSMFPAISHPETITPAGRKKVSDFMVSYIRKKFDV